MNDLRDSGIYEKLVRDSGSRPPLPDPVPSNIEIPCGHSFSVSVLRDIALSRPDNEGKYFNHLTGFSTYEKFPRVLEFVLPGGPPKKHHLLELAGKQWTKNWYFVVMRLGSRITGKRWGKFGTRNWYCQFRKRSCSVCLRRFFTSHDETSFRPNQSWLSHRAPRLKLVKI